jgi:N-acetylglucosaminyldiphosphoundecaprenol N-acetyl-beta-D-mannosaminyltransferase
MKTVDNSVLLGVRFTNCCLPSLTESALQSVEQGGRTFTFACANPHSLVIAQRDEPFLRALQSCSAVVADGVGVKVAGRLAGVQVGPRITGADFFLDTMLRLNRRGGRVFFFGSSDPVLQRIVTRARRDYPNLSVQGLSPPFGAWSGELNESLVAQIREARPDVLWVGMTAPKQEKWVHDNALRLGVPVIGSIGAVFDFYAGTVVRAPQWIRGAGLEWLFRLVREPQRLWRRTLLSAPAFLWLVLRRHVFS